MSWLEDDGMSPEVTVIEDADGSDGREHRQALCVRVGPVYHGNNRDDQPGIWVEYQPEYLRSAVQGPVLMDVATWKALDKAVRARLWRWRHLRLLRRWHQLTHWDEW
jgi:hypothetical protein